MTAPLKVCFYNFYAKGLKFKRGTILRHVSDALEKKGVLCFPDDNEVEPDVYVFEKSLYPMRYKKPVVIHAENLIGEEAKRTHTYNQGNAIVFNSEWLRKVYYNTFHYEMKNAWVIPTGHQMDVPINRRVADIKQEQHIVCTSKWWKRPYKRFPLIASAVDYLNRHLGYPNAKLHVCGWSTKKPMLFYDTPPYFWKVPASVRTNPNIIYYERSYTDDTYAKVMAKAHVLVHVSIIDSGPQVVCEALSQGVPVVISNNMGAAEWVRDIGPAAGIVLDVDKLTQDFYAIRRLLPNQFVDPEQFTRRTILTKGIDRIKRLWTFPYFQRLCSGQEHTKEVAGALKKIFDHYEQFQFQCPRKYTMEGIGDQWLEVIESARKDFYVNQ